MELEKNVIYPIKVKPASCLLLWTAWVLLKAGTISAELNSRLSNSICSSRASAIHEKKHAGSSIIRNRDKPKLLRQQYS